MIKMVGINKEPIVMNSVDTPPQFYRKVSSRPVGDGIFNVEVYKLKHFNKFTKEATYVRQRDQKQKAKEQDFSHFPFSAKPTSYNTEE